MRIACFQRGGPRALLAGVIGLSGCTHNYYYGSVPAACPPIVTAPGTVQYGAVCDVPTHVVGGGSVVAQGPTGSAPAITGPRPPRVVVSTPSDGTQRFPWRRSDPDSGLATTRVEGALDDPSVTR